MTYNAFNYGFFLFVMNRQPHFASLKFYLECVCHSETYFSKFETMVPLSLLSNLPFIGWHCMLWNGLLCRSILLQYLSEHRVLFFKFFIWLRELQWDWISTQGLLPCGKHHMFLLWRSMGLLHYQQGHRWDNAVYCLPPAITLFEKHLS